MVSLVLRSEAPKYDISSFPLDSTLYKYKTTYMAIPNNRVRTPMKRQTVKEENGLKCRLWRLKSSLYTAMIWACVQVFSE